MTASVVKGSPSWKTTPARNVIVHTMKSAEGSIDSAKYGTTSPSAVKVNKGSNTAAAIVRPETARAEAVGSRPSTSASRPTRKVPPATGVSSAGASVEGAAESGVPGASVSVGALVSSLDESPPQAAAKDSKLTKVTPRIRRVRRLDCPYIFKFPPCLWCLVANRQSRTAVSDVTMVTQFFYLYELSS